MARYSPGGGGSGPPPSFSVTSFAHSPTLVQAGASVVNPAFTATYSEATTSATLTDTEAHTDDITSTPLAFSSPHTFTKTAYGATVTFTDSATGASGSGSANLTVTWGQNVYFGSAVDPGSYSQTFIKSLTAQLRLAPQTNYVMNAGAGESVFFAARSAFGLTDLSFFVGVFGFACSKVATVAVTNSDGVTENYDLFRSDNVGLGSFTLTVV